MSATSSVAQLGDSPRRRYYAGRDLRRVRDVGDLRAMAHRRMPRFVLEYLEGGAEREQSLQRDRAAYDEWRFVPRQLVDVSRRSLAAQLLGRMAPMPLVVAPTGLNGLFVHHGDVELAKASARAGVPFVQSTMSNDRMEDVGRVPGLRHWWQLYLFGGEEVWQELLRRADAAGCEALLLTTNAQIFGRREWSARTRVGRSRPSLQTIVDAALHPRWIASTLVAGGGLPAFANVVDFVPRDQRGFFETAFWIRDHQPQSMDWASVARIRQRWRRPFLLKGLLHEDDVRRALDAGVDGIVLGTHGGRQLDSCVSALDVLPAARRIVGGRMAIYASGGVRCGTDLLKALALGADAVLAGRAPLYGLCAAGAAGAAKALELLHGEAHDALGLLGANSVGELGPRFLARLGATAALPATICG
ncbi:alpha-hydroxy acid oxidase [Ramlibacter humi]|uniref:Alpha-hydroxy-acid oxidizing protein n=1 Tax=Ramlibacter humi TaxID=2530451 RepID=A0A4Z0BEE3_9BURK|nr:alpha-hydroxy acid oxidase [Ramlibacter humi]TFY97190.1 alpha-hydroxy-acid oxidizing protein [Ramlibacter humi]